MTQKRRRWSKLRSRAEVRFDPARDAAIHCSAATVRTRHETLREPSSRVALGGEAIWHFPGPQLAGRCEGLPVAYFKDVVVLHHDTEREHRPPTGQGGYHATPGRERTSLVALTLRDYLDLPRDRLFEPMGGDRRGLGDALRVADRRIERESLASWGRRLPTGHAARRILHRLLGAGWDA